MIPQPLQSMAVRPWIYSYRVDSEDTTLAWRNRWGCVTIVRSPVGLLYKFLWRRRSRSNRTTSSTPFEEYRLDNTFSRMELRLLGSMFFIILGHASSIMSIEDFLLAWTLLRSIAGPLFAQSPASATLGTRKAHGPETSHSRAEKTVVKMIQANLAYLKRDLAQPMGAISCRHR